MADEDNDIPQHTHFKEFVCPDGYVQTKVPLNPISFLDLADLEARIEGADAEIYARFSEHIRYGRYANGIPIVYRTPKGALIASDLRLSDLVIYAEQNVKVHASTPRNPVHPLISVKIIEVSSRDDIPVQRGRYLEVHPDEQPRGRVLLPDSEGRSDG